MKDPRVEKPKFRTQEATSPYRPESTETSDRKLERRKRRNIAVIRLEKALFPPQSPVSMRLAFPIGSIESWARLPATIIARRNTMQETDPSPRERPQKTSDSIDNLHFNDWNSLLSQNAFLVFNTRFKSEMIKKKPCGVYGTYLGLSVGGQECLCHDPRRVLRLYQYLSLGIRGGATQAHWR